VHSSKGILDTGSNAALTRFDKLIFHTVVVLMAFTENAFW